MRFALLVTVLVLSPLAFAASTQVDPATPRLLAAAGTADGGLLVAFVQGDEVVVRDVDAHGAVGPAQVAATAPSGAPFDALYADASPWGVALLAAARSDAPGSQEQALLALRAQGSSQWTVTRLPGYAVAGQSLAVGIDAAGTAYALREDLPGMSLVAVRPGQTTVTGIPASPAFSDLALDAQGVPHACVTQQGGDLAEWTPAGTRTILAGQVGTFYACAMGVAPDGSAFAVAGALPLVGGSCLVGETCVGSPDAGVLVGAVRSAAGSWSAVPSDVPYWATLAVSRDAMGRALVFHQSGSGEDVYRLMPDGRLAPVASYPNDLASAIPRDNLAAPVFVTSGFEGVVAQELPVP